MMIREYYTFCNLLLLTSFTGVFCEELFGLRLTTENQKPQESTQYRFRYFVKDETTGDYKIQEETKKGDSVQGSYTIADPNGDLRTVTYQAGPGKGFEAKVNVQPNASPMKPILEATTTAYTTAPANEKQNQTEKPVPVESTIKHFPGGFTVDVTTNPEQKMGMNFSLKTTKTEESTTPTEYTNAETTTVGNFNSTSDEVQKEQSLATEGRDINEDSVEKEIKKIEEGLDFVPKFPDMVLSDNKTHLKFHKDPLEALLDERITQIARQLAETSFRREYEERKLGHVIPISVAPISTSRYMSKSYKFRPSEGPIQVLNHVSLVPQYVYRETPLPRIFPFGMVKPISNPSNPAKHAFDTTPDFQKISSTDNPTTEFRDPLPVVPIHVPTFFQIFSPYTTPTIRTKQNVPDNQVSNGLLINQITESVPLTSGTINAHIMAKDNSSES